MSDRNPRTNQEKRMTTPTPTPAPATNGKRPAPAPTANASDDKNPAPSSEKEAAASKTDAATIPWSPLHEKAKDEKHVRFASQSNPDYYVHVWESHLAKYGPPSHDGKPMLRVAAKPGASSKIDKEAEKAKLAAMTDEQKLAYAKEQRQARQAARAAKKAAERARLVEEIRADIAAGKI